MSILSSDTPGYTCKEGLNGVLYYGAALSSYSNIPSIVATMAKTYPATDVNAEDSANMYDNTDKSCREYVSQQPGLKSGSISTTIYRHDSAENTYAFLRHLYRTKTRGLFVYASGKLVAESGSDTLEDGDDGYMVEAYVSSFGSAQPIQGLQTVAVTLTICRHIADLEVSSGTLGVVSYNSEDDDNSSSSGSGSSEASST